ncbi:MAG TPA: YCF48-related protein [Ignavibacteriaceae bacterium]|nr:YCF48-related protein [Ignavibacteriaceae bacterium]
MNKIVTFSFLLVLTTSIYSQNFWQRIESPTIQRLNSIVFIDSLNGWVTGDSGTIFHTSNGGLNWNTQFSNDSLNVVNIFFLNDQNGWASAWSDFYPPFGTYFLKTTNGGINWNKQLMGIGEKFVNSFYFLDTLKGFAAGYPQCFLRTIDGGITWSSVNLDSAFLAGFPPYTIKFFNNEYGYACGGVRDIAGVVWRTTDGGINWTTVVDTLTSEPVYGLHIFDSLHVIAMGGDPEYGASKVVTYDGGNSWQYTLLGTLWYPVDVEFRNSLEGWAPMGAQGKFLYSSDAGSNWTELYTPDSVNVIKICFPDTAHGFGIGEHGDMVKYRSPYIPVELISFTASVNESKIILNWITSTEVNNYGFDIERQDANSKFVKLGFVKGNGTTTIPENYSYTDEVPSSGNYSYRLRQIDFDGTYKYSKVIEIKINIASSFSLDQNYPNPFNPSTMIRYSIPADQIVKLNVYNLLGQKIITLVDGFQKSGQHEVNFNASSGSCRIASGVYYYKLEAGTRSSIKKMILMK